MKSLLISLLIFIQYIYSLRLRSKEESEIMTYTEVIPGNLNNDTDFQGQSEFNFDTKKYEGDYILNNINQKNHSPILLPCNFNQALSSNFHNDNSTFIVYNLLR
jgi:hypothetical protein